ncbi:MAG: SAM-dependent chlorinase/fluorinase [Chloroflexota bacterium]|nr:SAM-dependent chlorinase/fluorinase [Chloroflexota bacterium]
MAVITLTTDFGVEDPYVAAAKGVILSINPHVTIVDISHSVQPQNIAQAAFLLSTVHHYFPKGTVHVAVVDPGVGTERRAVLLCTPSAYFVAPDNGILSYVIEETGPEDLEAYSLTNSRYWLTPPSDTFHCRDIFAPVAAHLSWGTEPTELGEPIDALVKLPLTGPQVGEDGVLIGHVIHVDRFGNIITDVKENHLPQERVFVEVHGHIIDELSQTYADEDELLALIGSSGNLEISVNRNDAARFLRAKIGDEVKVGINRASLKQARKRG